VGQRDVAQSKCKQHRPGRGVVERAPDVSGTISTTPIFFALAKILSGVCSFSTRRTTRPALNPSHIVLETGDLSGRVMNRHKNQVWKVKGKDMMMKRISVIACGLAMTASSLAARAEGDKAKVVERLTQASSVIQQIMATPDKSIPSSILAGASCVVVVPSYKKAAFVVGGQYGQGVATCRTPRGWSAPVCVQMAGGSVGFQIGGQATDLVMIAMNQQGLQDMLKNKFKLGADAAASAGPVGRNAAAGTDWKLNAEFLTYSRSKGLFAGINLDGTVVSQNQDDTRALYGADIPFETILKGNTPTPPEAAPFVRTVARYFVRAKAADKD
jgi:lipid-binding SYLF domain-containing protein